MKKKISLIFTKILTPLFVLLTKVRLFLYKKKILKSIKVKIPVLSIGNISMGGTGKTPFTLWLLNVLKKVNPEKKIGVVARNYKALNNKSERVQIHISSPLYFGDEAVLIQSKNPDVIVFSGPQKSISALELLSQEPETNILIIDDGFQHFKLERDLDIVLCDVSVPWSYYLFPPTGFLREPIQSLNRSHIIIFTKCEIKNEETYLNLKNIVQKISLQGTQKLIIESEQVLGEPIHFGGTLLENWSGLKSYFVFAGLAHPEQFAQTLKNKNLTIKDFKSLPDHSLFDQSLISKLIEESKGSICLTTEKDAVKLREWPFDGPPLFVIPMQLKIDSKFEKLLIDKLKLLEFY